MEVMFRIFCLLFYPLTCAACATPTEPVQVALAIDGVTVIDPASRSVQPNRTVYIDAGRIVAVEPTGMNQAHAATQRIDGAGKFLMPGLVDMHVHVAHPQFSESTLALLLANGVTGVREMSGDCWEPRGDMFACIDDYRALQAAIEAGNVAGPRLLAISSAIVRGPFERQPPHVPEGAPAFVTPGTADEARLLIDYLDARGVDLVKTYNALPREAYFALVDAARKRGLEVSGHVPMPVSVVEASNRGHRSIEHAKDIAYDCSTYGEQLRRDADAVLGGNRDVNVPGDAELQRRAMQTYDASLCARVLRTLAKNGTWYVPTHETREMDARAGEPAYRDDPRLAYVSERMRGFWQRDLDNTAGKPATDIEAHRQFFTHGLEITRLAHANGVKVMAGTDANDTMSIPGFSLHDELVHLARAGLPPMDVLRAATSLPAEYLGRSDDLGGVSAGMTADLLLLAGNPLDDISNTTRIAAVIFAGNVIDRQSLDGLLAGAKKLASRQWWESIEVVAVPADVLQSYAGKYIVPSSKLEITVVATENGLRVSAPGMPVIDFLAESETLFFMKEDETKFEFHRNAQGKVSGVRLIWSNGKSEFAPVAD